MRAVRKFRGYKVYGVGFGVRCRVQAEKAWTDEGTYTEPWDFSGYSSREEPRAHAMGGL